MSQICGRVIPHGGMSIANTVSRCIISLYLDDLCPGIPNDHLTSCQIYHRLRSSLHPFDTPSSPTAKTGPGKPSSIASQIRSIVLEESRSRYWPHMASASYGVDSELDNVGPVLNVFCRGVEPRSNLCHFPAVDDDVVPQSACAMGLPLSQDLLTLFRTRVPTTTCQWPRHS